MTHCYYLFGCQGIYCALYSGFYGDVKFELIVLFLLMLWVLGQLLLCVLAFWWCCKFWTCWTFFHINLVLLLLVVLGYLVLYVLSFLWCYRFWTWYFVCCFFGYICCYWCGCWSNYSGVCWGLGGVVDLELVDFLYLLLFWRCCWIVIHLWFFKVGLGTNSFYAPFQLLSLSLNFTNILLLFLLMIALGNFKFYSYLLLLWNFVEIIVVISYCCNEVVVGIPR